MQSNIRPVSQVYVDVYTVYIYIILKALLAKLMHRLCRLRMSLTVLQLFTRPPGEDKIQLERGFSLGE